MTRTITPIGWTGIGGLRDIAAGAALPPLRQGAGPNPAGGARVEMSARRDNERLLASSGKEKLAPAVRPIGAPPTGRLGAEPSGGRREGATPEHRVHELEQALQLKTDFAAALSHDLRTPLTVILGYADLLCEGTFGEMSDEQSDTLRRLQYSARAALELVNATLDVGRIENGHLPLDLSRVSVVCLLEEIEEETRLFYGSSQVRMSWHVAGGVPVLHTDRLKLKMVLKNLIGNAVKFTHPGGEVRLVVRAAEDGVEFAVTDTGIGIPSEAVATIFERYRQSGRAVDRAAGGVGLGLYIVRRLVGFLGGTITLESASGRGSTFRVRLPHAAPAQAEPF